MIMYVMLNIMLYVIVGLERSWDKPPARGPQIKANAMEEYVMLSIMHYVIDGLKRSCDKKMIFKTSGLL
eukprot:10678336-Karenia_brevis.AAC.1